MLNPEIQSKVHQLWDKFLAGGFSNPLSAIEQISYLLYMKWLDEQDEENRAKAKSGKTSYTSTFKGKFVIANRGSKSAKVNTTVDAATLRWSAFRLLSPKEMLEVVANQAFPFIKQLSRARYPLAIHLKDAVFLISRPSLLDEAVKIIDDIYKEIERQGTTGIQQIDSPGEVYEYLMTEIPLGIKAGQFRTPRHIVRMMVELVDPNSNDRICDPACGSGGFLVEAYRYILSKSATKKDLLPEDRDGFRNVNGNKIKKPAQWEKLSKDPFTGFDSEITMARTCLINLALHGVTRPQVEVMNTVSNMFDRLHGSDDYSIIFCNPPFGGNSSKDSPGKLRIEVQFINRILQLLKTGGQACIITTDSTLSDTSDENKTIRSLLLQTCELKAVISLPAGVFKPYANIQTAILIFTKVTNEARLRKPEVGRWYTQNVWFYDMNVDGDGYSMDDNRRPLSSRPLPGIISDYKKYVTGVKESEDRTHKHFFVPIQDIVDNDLNLSLARYKRMHYKEIDYEPPKEILAKLLKLEEEIMQDLKSLNELIK